MSGPDASSVLVVRACHPLMLNELAAILMPLEYAYSSTVVLQRLNSIARSPNAAHDLLNSVVTPGTMRLRVRDGNPVEDDPEEPRTLSDEYLAIMTGVETARVRPRSWAFHDPTAVIPSHTRLRLAVAEFASPGFFGLFAARPAAEVIESSLAHRRETRVLEAGGTAAEVAAREAEAKKLAAEAHEASAVARIKDAEADEAEARARARSNAENARSRLQELLLSQVTSAVETELAPSQLATLLADVHDALENLDRSALASGPVSSIETRSLAELRQPPS
jgi:hypothetical protein